MAQEITRVLAVPLAALLVLLVLGPGTASTIGFPEDPPVFLFAWGSPGSGDGQFLFPTAVATGPEGDVYVVDQDNDRVQKFTSDGVFLTEWGGFTRPIDVATDADGNVYVSDEFQRNVQKFTSDGTFLAALVSEDPSGLNPPHQPNGIGVDPDGSVYVAYPRVGDCCIRKFNSAGELVLSWGTVGSGEGQFDSPRGVDADADGNVYVADSGNGRIQKFTAEGVFLTAWDVPSTPIDVVADADGTVYVVFNNQNLIRKFTSTGEFLTQWPSPNIRSTVEGFFNFPWGADIHADGNIYVADRNNHRIQVFAPATPPEPENSPPTAVDDAITLDEDTSITFDATANDSDADGDPLSVPGVGAPSHGVATLDGSGNVTYTPDPDYNGADAFTYDITDGNGGSATGNVDVTVIPVNDAPVAVDDSATTAPRTPVVIDVLANDTDVDGDTLGVIEVTQGTYGSVGINADQTVTYSPVTVDDLMAQVQALPGLNRGQKNALLAKLRAAKASLARGNLRAAAGQLGAFKNQVRAFERTGKLDPATADRLVGLADAVLSPPSSDSFEYTVGDGNGGVDTAIVTVTIS